MPAPRGRGSNPSDSVLQHLHAAAPTRPVNSSIPVSLYYRSAVNLQRQAQEYRRASNSEQLYVMLLRYISLVLETIPKHNEYRKNDIQYQQLRAASAAVMEELEELKMRIRLQDKPYLEDTPYLPTRIPDAVRFPDLTSHANDVSVLETLGTPEWERRVTATDYGLQKPELLFNNMNDNNNKSNDNRMAISAFSNMKAIPDLTPSLQLPPASTNMLSKHALVSLPHPASTSTPHSSSIKENGSDASAMAQPTAPPTYSDLLASISPYADSQLQLGPQQVQVSTLPYPQTLGMPSNAACCQPPIPSSMPSSSMVSAQSSAAIMPPTLGLQEVRKRQKIRDVHLSLSLMKEFLRYAQQNTRRSIETCGILAGRLSPDDARFTITALIIPKQEGTTDTVQALAEEEIFEVQDSRSLYPLGWIHTHPTQSCFLSSVDVHTQCGYQTMLDEAVAIVMAPSQPKNQMGVFRLSTPGGLNLVQRCLLRGFHAHPATSTGQPLYEECSNVYLNDRIGYEVIDLR